MSCNYPPSFERHGWYMQSLVGQYFLLAKILHLLFSLSHYILYQQLYSLKVNVVKIGHF